MERKTYVDFKVGEVIRLKNRYGYRITLIYPDGSEKIQQKGGFTKEKDAKKARDLTVAELYSGSFVVDESLKVKDFLSEWHETVIKKKKATTYSNYHYQLKNHIYPALGNLKLSDLNKGHLIKFYANVSKKSYSSAKNCRVILLTALRYAVGKKLISENPAEDLYVPKSETDKQKEKKKEYRTINIDSQATLTVEQLKLLIEKAKESKVYMYILFAGLMGLRKSEILGLKYSDVDFTRQTLYVQRQLGKDLSKPQDELPKKTLTKQEVSLKTRSSKRILDIPDIVFNAILEQRRIYEKNRRRRPGQFQDEGYICCSSYGRPQSASYCYKEYKRLLSDNGLPNIRFHDLRHTYATILTNEEIDVKAISNSLGHSKTIITVDVYTDKKQMIVDVSEQTQEFACEIFPISYLQERQVEEANRTRFLKEIYYFPEQLAEEIMGIIL